MMQVQYASDKKDAGKATIGEINAIRLMLDKCKNVDEAITELNEFNIEFEEVPFHYFIANSKGKSTVIGYIDGLCCPKSAKKLGKQIRY